MSTHYNTPGYQRLWGYFGLSYSSWVTLPRVLMHEMPSAWQDKMAGLLEEFDETFPDFTGELQLYVNATGKNGKYAALPEHLNNYRHPNYEKIDALRRKSVEDITEEDMKSIGLTTDD